MYTEDRSELESVEMMKMQIGKYRPNDGHIAESNAWNSFAHLAEILIALDVVPYRVVGTRINPHRMYNLWVTCQPVNEDELDLLKLD